MECETESQAKVRRDVPWLDFSDLSELKRGEFYSIYGKVPCICLQNSHFCCLLVVSTVKMDIENNFIGEFMDDLAYITDNEDSSESSNEEEEVNAKQVRTYRRSKLIPFYKTRKDIFTFFEKDKLIKTFRFDRTSIEFILSII